MRTLIDQCWNQDPDERPSFVSIFDMFARNRFDILPDVDESQIRNFADGILAWEERAGTSATSDSCEAALPD
jgi:hypothetical protein